MKSCILGARLGLGDTQCASLGLSIRQGQHTASWDCMEAGTCLLSVLSRGGGPCTEPCCGSAKKHPGKVGRRHASAQAPGSL